jgi:hypothetical protein
MMSRIIRVRLVRRSVGDVGLLLIYRGGRYNLKGSNEYI